MVTKTVNIGWPSVKFITQILTQFTAPQHANNYCLRPLMYMYYIYFMKKMPLRYRQMRLLFKSVVNTITRAMQGLGHVALENSIMISQRIFRWIAMWCLFLWIFDQHGYLWSNVNWEVNCTGYSSRFKDPWKNLHWMKTGRRSRYRPRFFDQVGHQTTYAYIKNKHFFTKSCHCQTYQNYEQPPQRVQNLYFQSHFQHKKSTESFWFFMKNY